MSHEEIRVAGHNSTQKGNSSKSQLHNEREWVGGNDSEVASEGVRRRREREGTKKRRAKKRDRINSARSNERSGRGISAERFLESQ